MSQKSKLTNTFGQRMLAFRRASGLTQVDLSERTDLAKSYISLLENGLRQPSREVVIKIADAVSLQTPHERQQFLALAGFSENVEQANSLTQSQKPYSQSDFKSFLESTLDTIRKSDFKQAENMIERGLKRFKRPAQMQTLLAHLELARGHFEQAVLFQSTAVQLYDLSPEEQVPGLTMVDFLRNLGVMCFLWGDQALFESEETAPKNSKKFQDLAIDRYQKALKHFEHGIQLAPNHLSLLDEAGRVHFNLADLLPEIQATPHWQSSIHYFQVVISHPDKKRMRPAVLREAAAFMALANAKVKHYSQACLILDLLEIEAPSNWLIPYVRACVLSLGLSQFPQNAGVAMQNLKQAINLDSSIKAQALKDRHKDLALLVQQDSVEFEKVVSGT